MIKEVYLKTATEWKQVEAYRKNETAQGQASWDQVSSLKPVGFPVHIEGYNSSNRYGEYGGGSVYDGSNYVYSVPETSSFSDDIMCTTGTLSVKNTYGICTVYPYGAITPTVNDTYNVTGPGELHFSCAGPCLAKGTLITLADMSTKPIEDITYNDRLLVWDFDNGCLTSAKPAAIFKPGTASCYNHLVFSDGSHLDTVNQHRIFNKEQGKFTYPMTEDTPVSTTTINYRSEEITLVSKEVINEPVEYYNIITENHYNLFANTILTSCRLNNMYPIKDMKFVKDDRIIKPKSEFPNLTDYEYRVFRAGEQPIAINAYGDDHGDKTVEDYIIRCRKSSI